MNTETKNISAFLNNIWPAKSFQEKIKLLMLELNCDFQRHDLGNDHLIVTNNVLTDLIDSIHEGLCVSTAPSVLKPIFDDVMEALSECPHTREGDLLFSSRSEMAEHILPIIRKARRALLKDIPGSKERAIVKR